MRPKNAARLAAGDRIARPRGAAGEGQRQVVTSTTSATARRRPTVRMSAARNARVPGVTGVDEGRARGSTGGRSATIRGRAAGARAGSADRGSRPRRATRPRRPARSRAADRSRRGRNRTPAPTGRTAGGEHAARPERAPAAPRRQRDPARTVWPPSTRESRARRTRRAGVGIGSQRRAARFDGRLDGDTFLRADRIAELAAAVVKPSGAQRSEIAAGGPRQALLGERRAAERVALRRRSPPSSVSVQRT